MIRELLLPRTDLGVAAEAILAATVLGGAFALVRRDRELRVFVAGFGMFTLALFVLRAFH